MESKAPPAPPAPVLPSVTPPTSQATPEIMRDVKPETAVTQPKPAVEPVAPAPPSLPVPKDIETPAESRAAAKPELPPITPPSSPAPPALPPVAAPKAAEPPAATAPKPPALDALPPLTPPTKPNETKPPIPEKKDDPFGTRNDLKTLRQWTDASGKYHIEARFVSYQDGTVRLQKADGRYYRVKYDRLCADDQDFVLHQDGALFAAE
jgi:hypothetical protein